MTTNERGLVLGNSVLRSIHGAPAGVPLGIARDKSESYTRIRDQLVELGAPVPAISDPFEILTDRLARSLDNGKRLTPTAAGRIYADAEGAVKLRQATELLRERLTVALAGAARNSFNPWCKSLDAQLQGMVTETRELRTALGGDPGVEAAPDAGLLTEHKRLRVLRRTYVQLRDGQAVLFRNTESMGRKLRDVLLCFIADPIAADDEYIARRMGWTMPGRLGDDTRPPDPAPFPELWTEAGLDWLADHPEAKPWVPSRAQLAKAEAEIQQKYQQAAAERGDTRRSGPLIQTGRLS